MQKRRTLESNVHERRLHSGQHSRHSALVEIADEPAPARALHVDFLKYVGLDNRSSGFAWSHVDENFDRHRDPPCQHGTPAARNNSAVSNSGRPITPE